MNRRRTTALGAAIVLALGLPGMAGAARTATAIFAGGCFWTMEHKFEETPGVIEAVSGFTGGREPNPTYEQVVNHQTHHVEAVKVTYDPDRISYRQLVDAYWHMVDPTDLQGQACDRGANYSPAIFVASPAERKAAEASKAAVNTRFLKDKILVPIRDSTAFWPAGPEHQDFARKNAATYNQYNQGCGRDRILRVIWGRD